LKGYIITGTEACRITGVNSQEITNPVEPNKVTVYTNMALETYQDIFRLYHYIIYPHYLSGVPAIFAVPDMKQLKKQLTSIPDPPPVSCPLTGEKALRHIQRLRQLTKLPDIPEYEPPPALTVETPLDPDQSQAAAHFTGPALVIAPAGSGKTMTLVARVMLLVQRGIDPEHILCITFTRKAQTEMRMRLVKALGAAIGNKITIKTYHALAYMLLNELTGEKPNLLMNRYPVLTELIGEEDIKVNTADTYISHNLNNLIMPEQTEPQTETEQKLSTVYAKYQQYLAQTRQLDQDNLLFQLCRILQDNPIKRSYLMDYSRGSRSPRQPTGRWHFILVDESQDNNLAQDVLTRFIAAPWDNIYWVGDEDQLLYSFRGSSIERMLNLKDVYPNIKELYLKTNYRSHPEIVQTADKLISCNTKRRPKVIIPFRDDPGPALECRIFPDPLTELGWVAEQCKSLIDSGVEPDEIALLYRTNAQADICASELAEGSVPHYIHRTGTPLFETPEAQTIISYLEFVYSPSIEPLANCLKQHTDQPAELIKKVKSAAYLLDQLRIEASTARQWKVVEFCDDMKTLSLIAGRLPNVGSIMEYVRKKFNLDRHFGSPDTSDRLGIIQAVASKFTDLQDFLRWVSRVRASPRDDRATGTGKVQLMTVHSAKGLEFPYVFIVNATEGHMPHAKADDIEEERRIFYVALTRARDSLTVTGYQNDDREISRFVVEACLN
jgi:DNA helicase-2/ATP-dependent DNA helicase PcrA